MLPWRNENVWWIRLDVGAVERAIIEDTRNKIGRHKLKNQWFAEHGIEVERRKLDFGDYARTDDFSNIVIDTKKDVDELAMDCGKDHRRFVDELDRAAASGCRLIILVEQHPEFNNREKLKSWLGYSCRRCRKCDPNAGDKCRLRRFTPMHGERLAKILDTLERKHHARFRFCAKRDTARIICETLGIDYE